MAEVKLTKDDVLMWAWWEPGQADEPAPRWWNDNDRLPSSARSLGEHLAESDWKGWRILAVTRDGRKVTIERKPALSTPTDDALEGGKS